MYNPEETEGMRLLLLLIMSSINVNTLGWFLADVTLNEGLCLMKW